MTLQYSIDRTSFRDLVDVALRRIPTASRGTWTLHAPVDPGITLVELFAWLLEQRSYLADRTTAPLVRALLSLFGDSMRGARSAGVAITFSPELTPDNQRALAPHAVIDKRTALRVPETELVFTLRHGLTALALLRPDSGPPAIELEGVPGFSGEDLRAGRAIPLLATGGGPAQARFGLRLAAPIPSGPRPRATLLFELDTEVEPEWSPDAVAAPAPAAVRFDYQDQSGQWRPLERVHDGTLGLRRSGIVRFAVPDDWSFPVAWLRVATDRATFSSPPVLLRLAPNSALATHEQWRELDIATPGWLPLPGCTIELEPSPPPLPSRAYVCLREPSGLRRYRIAPDFTNAGPADRVATLDRSRAKVVFGDGLTGRLPRLAAGTSAQAPAVRVFYAAGGGRAGNVAPQVFEALDGGSLPDARSWVPAVGGRDEESLDDARARATAALRKPARAVTPGDHAAIACATAGVAVARAHAEVGFVAGECGVVPGVTTVFVVPGIASRTREQVRNGQAVSAPQADPGMLDQVRQTFAQARLAGEAVVVSSAAYRHVSLRATVTGAPYDHEGLRRRLIGALRLYLDPLLGGDDGSGWPFGEPLRPTALLGVAQREAGDRGEVVSVAITTAAVAGESCQEVAIAPYELVDVDAVDVVIDTTPSAEVSLR